MIEMTLNQHYSLFTQTTSDEKNTRMTSVGFVSALRRLAGRSGALVRVDGQDSTRDASLALHFGEDYILFSDGCLCQHVDVSDAQGLICKDPRADLGELFDRILTSDGMVDIDDSRVMFVEGGMTVAAFALGAAPEHKG